MSAHLVYLALGANVGNPCQQLAWARDAIKSWADTDIVAASSLYQTPPWGVLEQPDFINAVVAMHTYLAPRKLLTALKCLETEAGRQLNGKRWGPRSLDLDILLYDDAIYNDDALIIPHERISERAFVLVPLAEVAADLVVPGQGRVACLLSRLDSSTCKKLAYAGWSV